MTNNPPGVTITETDTHYYKLKLVSKYVFCCVGTLFVLCKKKMRTQRGEEKYSSRHIITDSLITFPTGLLTVLNVSINEGKPPPL